MDINRIIGVIVWICLFAIAKFSVMELNVMKTGFQSSTMQHRRTERNN